jgi:hypothetical protein
MTRERLLALMASDEAVVMILIGHRCLDPEADAGEYHLVRCDLCAVLLRYGWSGLFEFDARCQQYLGTHEKAYLCDGCWRTLPGAVEQPIQRLGRRRYRQEGPPV